MITYTTGNLLESRAEALVNTVNTVGVMGKGIALMFKERFPQNFQLYAAACKAERVKVGRMFVTETNELDGPRWVVNFPTKQDWRSASKLEWIDAGLQDLKYFLQTKEVKSIAIPPLGAGNGGLAWSLVRDRIEAALKDLDGVEITVYEPTHQYQNVAKKTGVNKLTPARALIAELVRRYEVLGMDCSLLEIQKLAWFLERMVVRLALPVDLNLQFEANKYGPYAQRLSHMLNDLDGSYLHCEKRIGDAKPWDAIWFDDGRKDRVQAYLHSEAKAAISALEATSALIEGFESPFGMELLATIDWLMSNEGVQASVSELQEGLKHWHSASAGQRKSQLFDDRVVGIALKRLRASPLYDLA